MPMLALSISKLNSLTLPLARQYTRTNPLNQVARLYRWCIFWPQMINNKLIPLQSAALFCVRFWHWLAFQ